MVQSLQIYGSIGFISVDKIIHGKTYSYVLFYNHDIYIYIYIRILTQTSLFRLQIPFNNFVRTNLGEMSVNQMKMFREKVKSVGISILGGNSGVEGKYELGIDSIRVVNEDDVVDAPKSRLIFMLPCCSIQIPTSLSQRLKIPRMATNHRHETSIRA